jgi:hypothetical protein
MTRTMTGTMKKTMTIELLPQPAVIPFLLRERRGSTQGGPTQFVCTPAARRMPSRQRSAP